MKIDLEYIERAAHSTPVARCFREGGMDDADDPSCPVVVLALIERIRELESALIRGEGSDSAAIAGDRRYFLEGGGVPCEPPPSLPAFEANSSALSESDRNAVAALSALVTMAEIGKCSVEEFSIEHDRRHSHSRPYRLRLDVELDVFPAVFGSMSTADDERAFAERMMEFWTRRVVDLQGAGR
jgi:hypothetical protein